MDLDLNRSVQTNIFCLYTSAKHGGPTALNMDNSDEDSILEKKTKKLYFRHLDVKIMNRTFALYLSGFNFLQWINLGFLLELALL